MYARDAFTFFDTEPSIQYPKNGIRLDPAIVPEIKLERVSFRYGEKKAETLSNINLTISPGDGLAILGLNGAGKTTLIKLIMRIYDPTEGRILVNDIDLKEIDIDSWWHIVGVLFQEYATYNFSAREVIGLGRSNGGTHLDKAKEAAILADADPFVMEWEQQYDQRIGKEFSGGVGVSVGQAQKLALARVNYRNAKVMILDEPTASVDAESESKIFDRFDTHAQGKTRIVISHRFSTVRRFGKICVLKDGSILELGSHEELMTLNGEYARLFTLQAVGYQ